MSSSWARVFNRLFEMINEEGDNYYSGPRFISAVREADPYFLDCNQFLKERKRVSKSTSRKDYFFDILMGFEVNDRVKIIGSIIEETQSISPEKTMGLVTEIFWTRLGSNCLSYSLILQLNLNPHQR